MEALPHVVFTDKELSDYPPPIINDLSQKRRQNKRRSRDSDRDRVPKGGPPGNSDSSSSSSSNGSESDASSGDIGRGDYSYSSGSEGETDGNEELSEDGFNGASRRRTDLRRSRRRRQPDLNPGQESMSRWGGNELRSLSYKDFSGHWRRGASRGPTDPDAYVKFGMWEQKWRGVLETYGEEFPLPLQRL
jgi:hypothetical protein